MNFIKNLQNFDAFGDLLSSNSLKIEDKMDMKTLKELLLDISYPVIDMIEHTKKNFRYDASVI